MGLDGCGGCHCSLVDDRKPQSHPWTAEVAPWLTPVQLTSPEAPAFSVRIPPHTNHSRRWSEGQPSVAITRTHRTFWRSCGEAVCCWRALPGSHFCFLKISGIFQTVLQRNTMNPQSQKWKRRFLRTWGFNTPQP